MTTEVIVTEVNNAVIIGREERQVIVSGMIGPTSTTLKGLSDVDISNISAGSLLVYNAATDKWTATTLLNQQIVDAGQF